VNLGSTFKLEPMQNTTPPVPNHHADHPGFSGIGGVLAGLTMIVGRGDVARLAAERARVAPGDRVVDVGCGPGVAAREAARLGAAVTGVDPAAPMLGLARRLTRRRASIAWIEGSAERLPVADDSATVLWSIATVHHWHDVDAGLAEAGRVLVGGGRLLAIERRARPDARGLASHGWNREQAEAFAQRCRAAGFLDVSVETTKLRKKTVLAVHGVAP
jgi:ubiquinone/menaquinone biosynthesis C-methylase UbiE